MKYYDVAQWLTRFPHKKEYAGSNPVIVTNLALPKSMKFYHGSYNYLKPGTILTPQANGYVQEDEMGLEDAIEMYRPDEMIPRTESVFMVDDPDLIDAVGGGTEWIFTVEPLGPVERSDLGWYTELQLGGDEESAKKYWSGTPHSDEAVEYRTTSAKVLSVKSFDELDDMTVYETICRSVAKRS